MTVASLPPRPPPTALFPPPPPQANLPSQADLLSRTDPPPQAQTGKPIRREWHGIRVRFARLQYRDDRNQAWSTVAEAYETELDLSNVAEAYNVEQVSFLETGGIQLRQCDAQYRSFKSNDTGRVLITKAVSSFIVTFKGISDVIISENINAYRPWSDSKWAIIQFSCTEAPAGVPEILRPEDEPSTKVRNPTIFPLALVFQNPVSAIGKQFRLAFLRKSTKSKAYAFIWPALLCCLAGISFVYDRKYESDYKASLDDWAMRNKEKLASFTLRDVQSTISNKPSLEWHLERPAARQAFTPPPLPGPNFPLPVVRTPYPVYSSESSGAGQPSPFASAQAPSSSSAPFPKVWVPKMPPSIRPAHLTRTYNEAIEEGEATKMDGLIEGLTEKLRLTKLRAEEAQREVDTAQLLLDDAKQKQVDLFKAEKRARSKE